MGKRAYKIVFEDEAAVVGLADHVGIEMVSLAEQGESLRPTAPQEREVERVQEPDSDALQQISQGAGPIVAQVLSRAEVESIVDRKLSELRIYVLESDITEAQRAVKSVVGMATF